MRGTKKPLFGLLSLFIATFFFGSFSILARIVGYNLPLFYQNVVRAAIATSLFGITMLIRSEWKKPNGKEGAIMVLRGIIGIAIFIAFFIAVNSLPVSTTLLIFYSGSVFGGYVLGMSIFSEKLTKTKIISLLLAVMGLMVVYRAEVAFDNLILVGLALFSGLGFAAWSILSKLVADKYSTSQISFIDNGVGLFFSIVLSLLMHEQWTWPDMSAVWGTNILFGSLWFVVPFFVIKGFYHLEATIGSLVMLTEILFASLFAFFIFGESVTEQTVLGGALIVVAIILPEYQALRKAIVPSLKKFRL